MRLSEVGPRVDSGEPCGGREERRWMQRGEEERREWRERRSGPVFNWIPRRVIPCSASLAVERGVGEAEEGRKDTFTSSQCLKRTCKHACTHIRTHTLTYTHQLLPPPTHTLIYK